MQTRQAHVGNPPFLTWFTQLGWVGWLSCALGAVVLAVLANLYIVLGRPFGATAGIPIETTGPIGAVIATIVPYVWLALFAGMGSTFWLLISSSPRLSRAAWALLALILLCAGYPVYTGSLNQPGVALAGNVAVVGVASVAAYLVWPISRLGALLLLLVIGWVCLASVALVALITGQRF